MSRRTKLLLAEDEALIRCAMQEVLEYGGYDVVAADDGETAASLVVGDDNPYAALITDVTLGGQMDGWALARIARQQAPTIGVLYVTAYSADDWGQEAVSRSLLLQKPFGERQLLAGIGLLVSDVRPRNARAWLTQFEKGDLP